MPYVEDEWRSLNEELFDVPVPAPQMRWIAGDALMSLSVIAEAPNTPENIRACAVRGIRKARQMVERARKQEEAV